MTFTQNKKPSITVSSNKVSTYPFTFFEKVHTKSSFGSKFDSKLQIAVWGTKHTIITDKNKIILGKLISNPISFQNIAIPTKRINTRLSTTADQQSCSKTNGTGTTNCGYSRKEPQRAENTENSADWLKKEQPRNERGQFTSPDKLASKPVALDLSTVSDDDDFQYDNTSEGKPVHTNLNDELQFLPKETNLTQETGMKTRERNDKSI